MCHNSVIYAPEMNSTHSDKAYTQELGINKHVSIVILHCRVAGHSQTMANSWPFTNYFHKNNWLNCTNIVPKIAQTIQNPVEFQSFSAY